MVKMKEKNKTPEKQQNKMDTIYQMQNSKHWLLECSKNSFGTSTAKKDPGRNEGYTK